MIFKRYSEKQIKNLRYFSESRMPQWGGVEQCPACAKSVYPTDRVANHRHRFYHRHNILASYIIWFGLPYHHSQTIIDIIKYPTDWVASHIIVFVIIIFTSLALSNSFLIIILTINIYSTDQVASKTLFLSSFHL